MTHILADRGYPALIKQRIEKTNHRYRQGLEELRRRQRPGGITPEEFDTIRSLSRQSWSSECDEQDPYKSGFQTTYSSFHHYRKEPDLDGAKYRLKSRPTSPTRKNNPHPPSKVITLRMTHAPGFEHNSVSLPQGAYKVGQRYPKEAIHTDKRSYHSAPIHTTGRWNDGGRESEVSVYRWLKQCGVEEQEASRRITKKLEKELNLTPEVNAKYIGKQNPSRYLFGRYGGDKITDATGYKAAADRLWYREPLKTSYLSQ